MTEIEKAWPKYPGYRIDVVPMSGRVRVAHGNWLLAESEHCLRVEESNHVDRIYVPEGRCAVGAVRDERDHQRVPVQG